MSRLPALTITSLSEGVTGIIGRAKSGRTTHMVKEWASTEGAVLVSSEISISELRLMIRDLGRTPATSNTFIRVSEKTRAERVVESIAKSPAKAPVYVDIAIFGRPLDTDFWGKVAMETGHPIFLGIQLKAQ
jgi:hypothetical protein